MNLYQIADKYLQLLDKDELGAEDLESLEKTDGEFKDKAIAVAAFIMNKRAELMAIEQAIDRMEERSASLYGRIVYLTKYLQDNLNKTGISEISDHPEFAIKIKKNPPKIQIVDEKLIPNMYFTTSTVVKLDKLALKEALKDTTVPGAVMVQDSHVEIK